MLQTGVAVEYYDTFNMMTVDEMVMLHAGGHRCGARHSVPAVPSAPYVHVRRRDAESRPENFQQFIKHERRRRFSAGLLRCDSDSTV